MKPLGANPVRSLAVTMRLAIAYFWGERVSVHPRMVGGEEGILSEDRNNPGQESRNALLPPLTRHF